MITNHQEFINCIHALTKGTITYYSKKDKQNTTRTIAPVDYGPHARYPQKGNLYLFFDFEGTDQAHHTGKSAEEIVSFAPLAEKFLPSDVPKQQAPYSIPRDWR